jgi:hypothetical protein
MRRKGKAFPHCAAAKPLAAMFRLFGQSRFERLNLNAWFVDLVRFDEIQIAAGAFDYQSIGI